MTDGDITRRTYACRRTWHDRCDGWVTWVKPHARCACQCHPVTEQASLWDQLAVKGHSTPDAFWTVLLIAAIVLALRLLRLI